MQKKEEELSKVWWGANKMTSQNEYTFQAIISIVAETEEEARKGLSEELEVNEQAQFELIEELPVEKEEEEEEG